MHAANARPWKYYSTLLYVAISSAPDVPYHTGARGKHESVIGADFTNRGIRMEKSHASHVYVRTE